MEALWLDALLGSLLVSLYIYAYSDLVDVDD
jgi:hypothetical protein